MSQSGYNSKFFLPYNTNVMIMTEYDPFVKEFRIKRTGNSKNIKEEGDPHKTWRQETNDMKSEEVIERVKLLKVQDPIMNPKKPRFIVRFQILSMIEQALFELLSRINC